MLNTLSSPQDGPRAAASQLISKIAFIEVSRNQWPELIPTLLANVQGTNDVVKQSSLETLGYLCEELVRLCFVQSHLEDFSLERG